MIISLNHQVFPIGKHIDISMALKNFHFIYWRYYFFEVCTMDFWVPVVVVFYFRPRMRDLLWECCTFNLFLAMISLEHKIVGKCKSRFKRGKKSDLHIDEVIFYLCSYISIKEVGQPRIWMSQLYYSSSLVFVMRDNSANSLWVKTQFNIYI